MFVDAKNSTSRSPDCIFKAFFQADQKKISEGRIKVWVQNGVPENTVGSMSPEIYYLSCKHTKKQAGSRACSRRSDSDVMNKTGQ